MSDSANTGQPVPADAPERARALDADTSFLVQAPAGSGKTELLIQRFLVLLGRVQAPEEIVAVTFTRKAAGEMRHRILKALDAAAGPEPSSPHARLTWGLARAALERDARLHWEIRRYPSRLRVQTIDSLCASITRQMPRLAGFGAQPGIAEDASELHRAAARRTLASLEDGANYSEAVARLLIHLDTNFDRVERLLVAMLGARDQWLRHLPHRRGAEDNVEWRAVLEGALGAVVRDSLLALREVFPRNLVAQTVRLARWAADNLQGADPTENPIVHCAELTEELFASPVGSRNKAPDLKPWLGLAHLLLNKDGGWRASYTKAIGFPAPSETKDPAEKQLRGEMKDSLKELIGILSGGIPQADVLRFRLDALRSLPATTYHDAQWEILEALVTLLPIAAAHLRLVFQTRGEVDFTEVAMRASEALGTEDEPTDLALSLDYRIHHLLVDEFQDTSLGQYRLLERLTAGWEPGDGRTLFLVGDPMQSIYRFREAEVGLFLRSAADGYLGQVPIEFLRLRCNFRSDARIVEWVNSTFAGVLPPAPDALTGAVPYSPSIPARPGAGNERITVHPLFTDEPETEAALVAELVREALKGPEKKRAAILVRSRSHLLSILPALREARLTYRALDIDPLAGRPAVQDLLALTRALLHPADRIAWLAVLRAPWCGLRADDLHALAFADHSSPVWDLIRRIVGKELLEDEEPSADDGGQEELFAASSSSAARVTSPEPAHSPLSPDGMQRLERVAVVLKQALTCRCRPPLRRWVEGAWLALGGPACVRDATDLADAREYLDLLDDLDDGGDVVSFDALEERLSSLYALPDPEADGSLQVMTIHKAKGLEFDVVILPGLGRKPALDQKRLLLWAELPDLSSSHKLLLAPIEETGQSRDPIYSFIWGIHSSKGKNEAGRVLYVAATRAREHLHLIGSASPSRDKDGNPVLRRPPESTMLGLLWPAVEEVYQAAFASSGGATEDSAEGEECQVLDILPADVEPAALSAVNAPELIASSLQIRRLPSDWIYPIPPPAAPAPPSIYPPIQSAELKAQNFSHAGTVTRYIGTVIHRWLRIIATAAQRDGRLCDESRLHAQRASIRSALAQAGVAGAEVEDAADRVLDALCRTLQDDHGAWLLSPSHRDAAANVTLSGLYDGRIVTTTIDRTFRDKEGTRWIIDYKAATHEGGSLDRFLDTQLRAHHPELRLQAALFKGLHPEDQAPIRTGFYFPHLTAWREWAPEAELDFAVAEKGE